MITNVCLRTNFCFEKTKRRDKLLTNQDHSRKYAILSPFFLESLAKRFIFERIVQHGFSTLFDSNEINFSSSTQRQSDNTRHTSFFLFSFFINKIQQAPNSGQHNTSY